MTATLSPRLRLFSSERFSATLMSAMLRRASDRVPLWRARASVSACSGFSSRVTVLPTTVVWPSFSLGAWSIARTRMFDRMISELMTSPALGCSGLRSRLDKSTSTRSFGRMKPPAPVSGEISVETARMPAGRIAAMKPEPSALTSFCSRIGSPAMNGARAIMPVTSASPFDRSLRWMKLELVVAAGQLCHCRCSGFSDWPRLMSDLATRTSTVSTVGATAATGAGRSSDPLARYAATPPAPTAMVRTTTRAVFIRFTFHITPRRFRRRDGS